MSRFCWITVVTIFVATSFARLNIVLGSDGEYDGRWIGYSRFTTSRGEPCVSACEKWGKYAYQCYISDGSLRYCSPDAGWDIYGNGCANDCRSANDGCFTCSTSRIFWWKWNYCGRTLLNNEREYTTLVTRHQTKDGDECISECKKASRNSTEFTCRIKGSTWLFNPKFGKCSASPEYDILGQPCKNTCDYHDGYKYTWCKLQKGGWNYCGRVKIAIYTEYTFHGSKCITPCAIERNKNDMYCFDATSTKKPCSLSRWLAKNNDVCKGVCKTDSSKTYFWCPVEGNKTSSRGGSQGLISLRVFNRPSKVQIQPFPPQGIPENQFFSRNRANFLSLDDNLSTGVVTFFERLDRTGSMQYPTRTNEIREWADTCLDLFESRGYAFGGDNRINPWQRHSNGNIGVRLDLQGVHTGGTYYNLQLQLNRPRRPGPGKIFHNF